MSEPEIMSFDAETSSPVNLTTDGSDAYTRHPETRVLMAAYHPVGQPDQPALWLEGDPVPQTIIDHVARGGKFAGWNVQNFDRLVWNRKLTVHWGWPQLSDDAWVDSMHRAAAANKPRSLDGCAQDLGLGFKEDLKDRNRIRRITSSTKTTISYRICEILRGLIPVAASKKEAAKRQAAGEHVIAPELLEDLQWLAARCVQDVWLEEAVLTRLPDWPQVEPWLRMPYVDRRINDRGIMIDRPLVEGLIQAASKETHRLDELMDKTTFGKVGKTSTVEQLKGWLISRGVPVPKAADLDKKPENEVEPQTDDDVKEIEKAKSKKSEWILRKSDVSDLLARPDLPEDCRLALQYRAEASKVSIQKLRMMLRRADPVTDRLYGTMSLGGAQQTMRWASPGVNLYNTVRDVYGNPDEVAADNGLSTKKPEHKERIKQFQEIALWTAIQAGRSGDPDHIRSLFEVEKRDAQDRPYTQGVLTWISRMTRRTLCVPDGYAMPNGDFSQVEARITMWLAQQLDVLIAFAKSQDVYTVKASGIYKQPPEQITKTRRQAGKVAVLANGFGGGPKALITMGYNYGLLMNIDEATQIVKGFRDSSQQLVQYWYATDDAAANAVKYPGREFPVAPTGLTSYFMDPTGLDCLCCRLPSGRWLRYWKPRLIQEYWDNGKPKDRLSLWGQAVKGRLAFPRPLYHTILCLSGETKVVTNFGVKKLAQINKNDMVWDGTAWVNHDGLVFQGVKETVDFGGIHMTEDHNVWHKDGWKEARHGSYDEAASSYERYFRTPSWISDGKRVFRTGRKTSSRLARRMCMWQQQGNAGRAFEERFYKKLRLSKISSGKTLQAVDGNTRHVRPSCVLGVAINVRSMQTAIASGVEKLRRARDNRLPGMEQKFRSLLARYGFCVSTRTLDRTPLQQRRVFQRKLLLGYACCSKQEQTYEYTNRNPLGRNDGSRSLPSIWNRSDNTSIQTENGLDRPNFICNSKRIEPVYDLLNAGPNHRFTVIGEDGRLIIVSNCENQVQAIAADMLSHGLDNADRNGIPVLLHVYDSIAAQVRAHQAQESCDLLEACMLDQPSWTYGLPVAADVDYSTRFG